jgi:uncharacterized protein (UPF0261 family)
VEDQKILLALGRLEGKVDALIAQTRTVEVDIEKHDVRLRQLESSKAYLVGASAALAALVSYFVSFLN